jgi:hypothetical protein
MHKTPERDPATCDHKTTLTIRNHKALSFCRTCGFGFYNVKSIICVECLKFF